MRQALRVRPPSGARESTRAYRLSWLEGFAARDQRQYRSSVARVTPEASVRLLRRRQMHGLGSSMISYATVDWGGLMAASTLMSVPVVLAAVFGQRYLVAGLTAGATKG